jgi:hypothetical protein
MMFVIGLLLTTSAIGIPFVLNRLDGLRTAGAVRYMSARLHAARMHAVSTTRDTTIHFTREGESYMFASYEDGNGNGIRTADLQQGIDRPLYPPERLADGFAGVEFGALPGVPAVDGSSTAPGSDPIRLGSGDTVTFTPLGTSTAGSLYILGKRDAQYVVRLFAETGKIRILKFDNQARVWKPL